MTDCVDLAIIGGGCAGLWLAKRLARGGYDGSVRIIEPRAGLSRPAVPVTSATSCLQFQPLNAGKASITDSVPGDPS